MGAICGCGQDNNDIASFWRGLELRKITFEKFCKIFENNQSNWLNSGGDSKRMVDLKKCEELKSLLVNNELTENERTVFLDKLQNFVNRQSDKLTFFTCLGYFTKLHEDRNVNTSGDKDKNKKPDHAYVEELKAKQKEESYDKIFETLLKLAIKKNDHDDVTKLFIELVTEIPISIIHSNKKEIEEKNILYSKVNRERLFNQLKSMNSKKFYEYMFDKDNISKIHADLVKISTQHPVNDNLTKVRTTTNATTPTPGQ